MKTSEASNLTIARAAGFTFLFYIIAGITSMALGGQSQFADLLALLQSFSALVLGVTLYVITHKQGPALALMALTCRIAEAIQSGKSEIYFAVGSLLFCWLLLRGRMIPTWLAQLGVLASALLVIILPAQLIGAFGGTMSWASSVTWLVWLPALVFEVMLAFWLMIKGVNHEPLTHRASSAI